MRPRSTRAGPHASRGDQAGAASALAELLCLAATPTFAVMAVLSALRRGAAEGVCVRATGGAVSGMAFMYTIMSVFHSSAWLRWAKVYPIMAAWAPSFGIVPITSECTSSTASGSRVTRPNSKPN
jgi:hypothetical protein